MFPHFMGMGVVPAPSKFIFHQDYSDSVKRHLRGRHLSVLNLKFDFISDGGRTREKQIALSLKRHLFPHGGRESKAFWICFSRAHPPSEIKSNFKFKTLKRHLLKRHLTLSELHSSGSGLGSASTIIMWTLEMPLFKGGKRVFVRDANLFIVP